MISSESINQSTVGQNPQQRKRVRAGSISGRLRTASDLEEAGVISRHQKGYIKDLIISGDPEFQSILDRYEKGDKSALEELIRNGKIGRKQSIDILDDLDFDFLNALTTDAANGNPFDLDHDLLFDFGEPTYTVDQMEANNLAQQSANSASGDNLMHDPSKYVEPTGSKDFSNNYVASSERPRTSTMDSSISINSTLFDNVAPYLLMGSQMSDSSAGMVDYSVQGTGPYRRNSKTRANSALNTEFGIDFMNGQLPFPPDQTFDHHQNYYPPPPDKDTFLHPPSYPAPTGGKGKPVSRATGKSSKKDNGGVNTAGPYADPHSMYRPRENYGVGIVGGGSFQNYPYNFSMGMSGGNVHVNLDETRRGHDSLKSNSNGSGAAKLATSGNSYKSVGSVSSKSPPSSFQSGSASQLPSRPNGYIGAYSPEERRRRIEKFLDKRTRRVWTKKVKYDVRKNFADSRVRVKGRFVKKEDEELMKEVLNI